MVLATGIVSGISVVGTASSELIWGCMGGLGLLGKPLPLKRERGSEVSKGDRLVFNIGVGCGKLCVTSGGARFCIGSGLSDVSEVLSVIFLKNKTNMDHITAGSK